LATNDSLPLAGKRIVVTRAREQAGDLVRRLEEFGAEVLLLPTLTFSDPEDTAALDHAIRSLPTFDWVLFTSQNAVRFFCKRCRTLGWDGHSPGALKPLVAAVGPATAEAARKEGLRVDRVASRYLGRVVAAELSGELAGKKVLLPRSDRARPDLPGALRAAGAEVTDVVAYRTASPESPDPALAERIRRGEVSVVTFTSPSAFHHFLEAMGSEALEKMTARVQFAAIGPITARAIREAGFSVAIEAAESTATGLVTAIVSYFVQHSSSGAAVP